MVWERKGFIQQSWRLRLAKPSESIREEAICNVCRLHRYLHDALAARLLFADSRNCALNAVLPKENALLTSMLTIREYPQHGELILFRRNKVSLTGQWKPNCCRYVDNGIVQVYSARAVDADRPSRAITPGGARAIENGSSENMLER